MIDNAATSRSGSSRLPAPTRRCSPLGCVVGPAPAEKTGVEREAQNDRHQKHFCEISEEGQKLGSVLPCFRREAIDGQHRREQFGPLVMQRSYAKSLITLMLGEDL